ncbi:AEC family transporter [Imhoffiella purpurea]|uniref:Putative malonate transporter n=1 Tax=Imhoffiella purpurea TaxID=1249627 RepID=W9V235_9GAMM|nr:AEC family transporter [Imhoffiella purpurea]EXJ13364.1 putative malonate transporter [Imhoffiella purpurea]
MQSLLAITSPLFLLIALGAVSVRAGWIQQDATVAMGRYVLSFALPALMFEALSRRPLEDIIVGPFLVAYVCGSLIAFAIGLGVAAAVRRTPLFDNAFFGLGISMSNSGYLGYALIAQLLGDSALNAVAMAILTEVLVILPLTLVLIEVHHSREDQGLAHTLGRVLRMVAQNPLLLAIGLGLLFSGFGWHLPGALARTVDLLAGSAAAVALFAIGGNLAGQHLHRGLDGALAIAAGKLLIHPAAVLLMLTLVPAFDPTLTEAALILAGLPMVTIFPLLAQRYGQGERCASALLVTTLASFVTLNLGLWLFADL